MDELAASLARLYNCPQNEDAWALAARYAPLIRRDAREPFRPLAAGYTILRADGRSPSFPRIIRLKNQAALVIEYAIWWDWDIHHLYELEHIWVYVNDAGQAVRVEGSWHGEAQELGRNGRFALRGSHPVVYASPGKHAFAPAVAHFQAQHRKVSGITSRYAGSGGIAVNALFAGQIRRTPPDDRLVHSYLARLAFTPSWDYETVFAFAAEMLLPWPSLRDWIPGRVHEWLSYLRQIIAPEQYRYLRTVICVSIAQIQRAGQLDVDMAQLGVGRSRFGWPVLTNEWGEAQKASLFTALRACFQARVAAYLIIHDERIIPWLTRLLGRWDWSDYLMTGAARPEWVAAIKARLPHYRAALILPAPPDDVAAAAQAVGASYVHLPGPAAAWLTPTRIQTVRRAGLGIVAGPVAGETAVSRLQSLGVEAIVMLPEAERG